MLNQQPTSWHPDQDDKPGKSRPADATHRDSRSDQILNRLKLSWINGTGREGGSLLILSVVACRFGESQSITNSPGLTINIFYTCVRQCPDL
ncbi:hypothetical protein VTI28DRAFT_6865 [Corynascus sepedonium]